MELGLATQEGIEGLSTAADGTGVDEPKRAKKKKRPLGEDGVPERRGPTCMDAKSVLNQYLQKYFDRPVNKGEIQYSTSELAGGHQSSLVITGLCDTPLPGDIKSNAKDAEHSAAWMGLQTFKEVLTVPDEVIEAVQKELEERALGVHKKPRPMPGATVAAAASKGGCMPPACGGGKGKGGKFMPPWMMNPQMMEFAQMMMGWKGKGCCKGAGVGKGKAGRGSRTGGSGHEWEDAKCRLNTWLQLQLKRPLGKDEMRYQVQQVDGGHQATLTLVCMDMQEFAGEVFPTQKEAEKSAAAQALKHYGVEVASPLAGKRPGDGLNTIAAATSGAVVGQDPRSTLVTFLQTQLNRSVAQSEIDLQTVQYSEGCQTTVTFKFNGEQVVGEVGPTVKEAEKLAAAMVLQVYGGQGKGR